MSALSLSLDFNTRMSSRQIADAVGSRHDNVLQTIRALIDGGVLSEQETPYTHPQNGQTYIEFLLGFRDSMVVASGYSAKLRAAVIDRWIELETEARAKPAPVEYVTRAEFESRVAALEAAPAPAPRLPRKPPATSRILDFIRKRQSVTRSELLRQFREVSARGLDDALAEFQAEGVVVVVSIAPKVGRPSTTCRWAQ